MRIRKRKNTNKGYVQLNARISPEANRILNRDAIGLNKPKRQTLEEAIVSLNRNILNGGNSFFRQRSDQMANMMSTIIKNQNRIMKSQNEILDHQSRMTNPDFYNHD